MEKQRKGFETTVKTDLEAIDYFLRNVVSKLSPPACLCSVFDDKCTSFSCISRFESFLTYYFCSSSPPLI